MLVIPEDTQEYFREVHKIASDRGIVDKLDKALLYAHLYACDWVDPERARFVLYKDFAPLSFVFWIEMRQEDGSYERWMNGGLIYQGPDIPADGSAPSFTVTITDPTEVGWFMHT